MWAKFMDVKSGYAAQIWKEFLNQEGVAVRVLPPLDRDAPMIAPASSGCPTARPTSRRSC
jgi:hypothetical protein